MSNARRQAEQIIERMDAETQDIIRHTRMDLDGFLTLKGEARAARWRMLDTTSKQDLIIQQLRRAGVEWSDELVALWIGKYDTKWGGGPTPTEAATVAALSRLARESADHARAARRAGETADAAHFQRAATAYTNALVEYRKSVRPEQLPDGAYLLPSRRAGEAPHLVHQDGDWVCTCKAGASMHWPIALVIGLEVAADAMDAEDDAPMNATAFGQRLALRRQLSAYAA